MERIAGRQSLVTRDPKYGKQRTKDKGNIQFFGRLCRDVEQRIPNDEGF